MRFAFALLVSLGLGQSQEARSLPSFNLYRQDPFEEYHDHGNGRRLTNDHVANRYVGFGVHFIDVYFGGFAEKRTLAVQTSSDHTALPCVDCPDCHNPLELEPYNITASVSSAKIDTCEECSERARCDRGQCVQAEKLRDHSQWEGYEVRDNVYVGGDEEAMKGGDLVADNGFQLQFVCQTKTRGYFSQQVKDGVLGFSSAKSSFVNQMFTAGKIQKLQFSLCFFDRVRKSYGDLNAGVVTFGGYNPEFIKSPMVYAKRIPGNRWRHDYEVNITSLYLRVGGGESVVPLEEDQEHIVITPPGEIDTAGRLDSSVPFLTFDARWEIPFKDAWQQATGEKFSYAKRELTLTELRQFPTLLIELEGDPYNAEQYDVTTVDSLTAEGNVIVAVPPSHYMERLNTAGKPYRPRIQFDGDQGSYLASNMMQRHVISYEIDENRIGFAEALRCTAESAVTGRIGNRNVDGQEPEEEEEPTTISINTSGGSASSVGSGASSMAAVGGSAPVGNDDDIFVSDGEDPSLIIDEEKFYGGGCATATCRCFMGIGYVAIGTALAVAYRISRPKEKYLASFADPLEEAKRPMIRPSDGGMGGDMYRRRTPVAPDTEGGVFV